MTAIGIHQSFGYLVQLDTDARRRHLYCIGQTGVGKSTLLESMALADIEEGHGVCFIDPHGQSAERIANNIPVSRTQDVAYIEYDPEHPFGLNILHTADPRKKPLTVEHIVSSFRNIWPDSWGANLEDVLRNALYLLIDNPGSSLVDILTLLSDRRYRERLLKQCTNDVVQHFWETEFEAKADKQKAEETRSTTNKVRAFLSNPYLANILRGPNTLNISHLMNEGKILILNLAKGSWGETPSKLIGSLFIVAFAQAAEERASLSESERRDFYLYVDEMQNFQNEGFGSILSEARKMRLSLCLANQYYAQLPDSLQTAISGNVGTWVAFRVGAKDAPFVADELDHQTPATLKSAPNFTAWVRLLQGGIPREPMPIRTLPPPAANLGRLDAVRRRSRACHTRRLR
jgi:energy-coupling factor transporter ATP-binding protein EcfA2